MLQLWAVAAVQAMHAAATSSAAVAVVIAYIHISAEPHHCRPCLAESKPCRQPATALAMSHVNLSVCVAEQCRISPASPVSPSLVPLPNSKRLKLKIHSCIGLPCACAEKPWLTAMLLFFFFFFPLLLV
ncbi:hypothetical protein ABBQ38_014570 [Trebouxia sp. C0009 RCD-2024]